MLRIGYVRLPDRESCADTAMLKAAGCHVVRAEEHTALTDEPQILGSILDFIGAGDQLVVTRLDRLALTGRDILDVLDRLEARGATFQILEPELCSDGPTGAALRAVLEAVSAMEPARAPRRRPAEVRQIRALQQAGVGPVEIARRLGVSRMTVWRKLRAIEA